MAKKTGKKESGESVVATAANGVSAYDVAVSELKKVTEDSYRRKVESSALKEARGQDVLALHATLTSVETARENVASILADLTSELDSRADGIENDVSKATDTITTAVSEAQSKLAAATTKFHKDADAAFEKTWDTISKDFTKTWDTLSTDFNKTWEAVGQQFEATNERTKREIHDLRDEVTKVLDKRFTHVDQTFASIRADLEVIKALQMELIKERIGRPEIVRR